MAALTLAVVGSSVPAAASTAPQPAVIGVTVAELQRQLRAGETSSLALVREHQRRIARFDGDVRAFLALDPYAQADARALDVERSAGTDRGPLHGIPLALKDLVDTVDLPTTGASVALAGARPPDDASAVRALQAAGAISLGKTNLTELARGYSTDSSLGGQTRNPFDQGLQPGGSSGGTAAAVAAAFAPVGLGTDTCGSVRVPAAFNGLVGFRPTQGSVDMDGVLPLSRTQDVFGMLGRDVRDVADAMDAATAAPGRYTAELGGTPLAGARIGLYADLVDSSDDRVRARMTATVTELRALGAEVLDVSSAAVAAEAPVSSVISYEASEDLDAYLAEPGRLLPPALAPRTTPTERATTSDLAADERVIPPVLAGLRSDQQFSRDDPAYADRLQDRADLQRALDDVWTTHRLDALLYPTARTGAAPIGQDQQGADPCALAAHSGRPAVTVPNSPAGDPGEGLSPNGMELLGSPGGDAALLALAQHYEQSYRYTRPAPVPALPPLPACDGTEQHPFTDVGGTPHEPGIACLAAEGVAQGQADGSFGPTAPVTRGQFASLLVRSLAEAGVPLPAAPDAFDDDTGSTHASALDTLASLSVMLGVAPRQAAPDAALPRSQAAVLLGRAYAQVFAIAPRGRTDAFTDDDATAHEPDLNGLAALDVVRGSAGRVQPAAVLTRGQMASLLQRAFFRP